MTIVLVMFAGCVGFMLDMSCAGNAAECRELKETMGPSIAGGMMGAAILLSLIIGAVVFVAWLCRRKK